MKRFFLPLFAAVLLLSAGTAFAQNQKNQEPSAISQEERTLLDKHHEKMTPLYDKMWAKQMEYDALAQNPNTKSSEISAIVSEMTKLREDIRREKTDFAKTMSDKGYWTRHGMGYGKGYYGHGKGMGHGMGMGHGCPYGDYDGYGHKYKKGHKHDGKRYHHSW